MTEIILLKVCFSSLEMREEEHISYAPFFILSFMNRLKKFWNTSL